MLSDWLSWERRYVLNQPAALIGVNYPAIVWIQNTPPLFFIYYQGRVNLLSATENVKKRAPALPLSENFFCILSPRHLLGGPKNNNTRAHSHTAKHTTQQSSSPISQKCCLLLQEFFSPFHCRRFFSHFSFTMLHFQRLIFNVLTSARST